MYTDHSLLALWPVSLTSNKHCLAGRAHLVTLDILPNIDQALPRMFFFPYLHV